MKNNRIRKKVDPVTGKPSAAENAISYIAFRQRQRRKRKRNNSAQANKKAKQSNIGLRIFDNKYRM